MELALQLRGSYAEVLRAAQWAEARGLAAFAVPDHYVGAGSDPSAPAYDHLFHLAGLARETSRIELVCLVSPITFRHPAVLAKTGVTIDEMSGGRFALGVGTGWMEKEHSLFGLPFPPTGERFDLLEEALLYLRAYLEGTGFEGRHYRLEEFDAFPKPANLRLVVGGSGKLRTPALAGRMADEFNAYCRPIPELVEVLAAARSAAATAGRRPGDLMISSACPVVVGTTAAKYRMALERAADRFRKLPEEVEKTLRESGYPIGLTAGETMAGLSDAGVQRFYVQSLSLEIEDLEDTFDALDASP